MQGGHPVDADDPFRRGITPEILNQDWSAVEVSVHLRWNAQVLDVSGLILSLTVFIAADQLVNEENPVPLTTLYAMMHQAPEAAEAMLLPGARLEPCRRYVLAADYAGEEICREREVK